MRLLSLSCGGSVNELGADPVDPSADSLQHPERRLNRRKTSRDIVRSMLIAWGEYEALGLYSARAQRSMLGKMGETKPTGDGKPLPPIWIPRDVQEAGRLVALMREQCRAGERYYKAIRKRYVAMEDIRGDAIDRAERWIIKTWLSLR